eukprot:904699-Rhodomonas_salina.1
MAQLLHHSEGARCDPTKGRSHVAGVALKLRTRTTSTSPTTPPTPTTVTTPATRTHDENALASHVEAAEEGMTGGHNAQHGHVMADAERSAGPSGAIRGDLADVGESTRFATQRRHVRGPEQRIGCVCGCLWRRCAAVYGGSAAGWLWKQT